MDNGEREEIRRLIADYMDQGFLENIIDMFKHDPALFSLVGNLISDKRIQVRIGITALMEELVNENPHIVKKAIPSLIPNLKDSNPLVRGDSANLLDIIGGHEEKKAIEPLLEDSNPQVVEVARDILDVNR